jgi:ABC-type multidrug transport system ATPase subunit
MLEVINLSKSYGKKNILQDVSFHLHQECLGLLGPNGAGKSTLLKIICDLVKPSEGSIVLSGIQRSEIATVFEEHRFLDHLSGLQNVNLFLNTIPGAGKPYWPTTFDRFGLSDSKNVKYKFYSSGMKRRLDLMSVLLANKQLFLLDEPTNALDINSIIAFSDEIIALKKQGKAFIISSHHAGELEKVCDRFLIINKGRILVSMKKEEMLNIYETLEKAYLSILSSNSIFQSDSQLY